MSSESSFRLPDTMLLTLCRRWILPPPAVPVPETTEDPFWSSGTRHTAASDSHGHRDRQQTRQLRKDFALLFSIINEQQSQQIRTEGGWGLPVCCSGAKRSTLGLTTKSYTPTDLLKCVCAVYLSFLHGEMPLRAEGAKKYAASTVGGIMRAEMYSIALPVNLSHRWQVQRWLLNNCTGRCFTFLASADDMCIRIM